MTVLPPDTEPTRLAGVTFKKIGKLHFYPAADLGLDVGSQVIAQTERGLELGEVKILRDVVGQDDEIETQFRIVRVAHAEDQVTWQLRQSQAQEGQVFCQGRADLLYLSLKIVDAEVTLSGEQITFYFVADTRVDFRQLVKEVGAHLRMRVHLHQVGSRDHAKQLGGYGPCGRPLCCTTFLRDFAPVSMKMAKDQSLYLNPSKFSGVCGKLMCCLRYEHDVYLEAKARLPGLESTVRLPDGETGTVIEVNPLTETLGVRVRSEESWRIVRVPASQVQVARACGDCGSAGGGCGSSCGSGTDGGCAPAKVSAPIALEVRRKTVER